MSAVNENQSSISAVWISGPEILILLERLIALVGTNPGIVQVPLDGMLTAKQAAKWLQCCAKNLNEDAKSGRIPACPRGNEFRFHPRTILEEGHRRYRKLNKLEPRT